MYYIPRSIFPKNKPTGIYFLNNKFFKFQVKTLEEYVEHDL